MEPVEEWPQETLKPARAQLEIMLKEKETKRSEDPPEVVDENDDVVLPTTETPDLVYEEERILERRERRIQERRAKLEAEKRREARQRRVESQKKGDTEVEEARRTSRRRHERQEEYADGSNGRSWCKPL